MRVTIWGARGSIPVSGPEYVRFGGDTTCLEVRDASGEVLLVDAGTGIRRAGDRLDREGIRNIRLLFTHAHWDHILGFPFFRPLYTPGVRIEIHGCADAVISIREILERTMRPPTFPVDLGEVAAELVFPAVCPDRFSVGGVGVGFIPLSHPNGGVGYSFEEAGRRLVFLTDNELGYVHPGGRPAAEYARFAAGADVLLHDAEFTAAEYGERQGWGHSVWEEALALALDAGVGRLGLWHHNMERTDGDLDEIVAACRARVPGTGAALEVFAARQGEEIVLS